jgi:hypothetical protein
MHWMIPGDRFVLFVKLYLSVIAFFGGGIVGHFGAIVVAALHYKVKSVLLPAGCPSMGGSIHPHGQVGFRLGSGRM